jgi:uncharacterized protein
MKKYNYFKIVAGITILIFSACKVTKSTTAESVQLDPPLNTERTLFWQVSGNGLTKPSYLFGTMHLIHFEQFYIGKNVEKKLRKASLLVMEVDLKRVDIMGLTAAALLTGDKTMKDYIGEESFERIQQFFQDSIGVNPMVFATAYSRMKPFFVEQMLVARFLGENPASYESEFSGIADDLSIPIEGLETMQEQLEFLDQIPLEKQFEQLMQSVDSFSRTRHKFQELVDAYANNDLMTLAELLDHEWDEDSEYRKLLLDKRNENWIPQLEDYFARGNVFIAVGAGHLGGVGGLITMLRKKGYTVDPIAVD